MKAKQHNKKKHGVPRSTILWILLLFGFCAMEFPGIFFVKNRAYPFLFGLPFLYGYILCCWAYMCGVLFYAWKTRWGKRPFLIFRKK